MLAKPGITVRNIQGSFASGSPALQHPVLWVAFLSSPFPLVAVGKKDSEEEM